MIVLPVEKRFDWSNPPLMLLCICLLNVGVFLFYQSGDGGRAREALTAYVQQGYFEAEWPYYQIYLEAEGEQVVREARSRLERAGPFAVSFEMLSDAEFGPYLRDVWDFQLVEPLGSDWYQRRVDIRAALVSMSSLRFGLVPAELDPLRLITYQFLHGDMGHLLGNMLFLMLCGFAVEAAVGHLRFALFYLITGAAGGLAHAALDLTSTVPLIGASASVSGVMAMYLALFRLRRIEFFYWLFVLVGYVRLPALVVLPLYIAKEVYFFYTDPTSSVAFMAHAGGFVCGALLIGLVLAFKRDLLDEDYIDTDQDADPERDALAEIYAAIEHYRFDTALTKLDVLILDQGVTFERLRLRRQLLKVIDAGACRVAGGELVALSQVSAAQVAAQMQVIEEDPTVLETVPSEPLIKLGMRMCKTEHVFAAERALKLLVDRDVRDASVAALARRLAESFAERRSMDKARRYQELAKSLA